MSDNKKNYNPKVEKFIREMKTFFNNYDYSLGEMLHSLNLEISKKGDSIVGMDDDSVIECLEKAIVNERE